MQLIKHAGVALVSAPFVWMGVLMTINGARRQVVSFAAAGLVLVTMMAVSAFLAIGNIAEDGPVSFSLDLPEAGKVLGFAGHATVSGQRGVGELLRRNHR